jgi:hypothetical protein
VFGCTLIAALFSSKRELTDLFRNLGLSKAVQSKAASEDLEIREIDVAMGYLKTEMKDELSNLCGGNYSA